MDDDELRHQHWTHSRLDKGRRDFIRGFPYSLREEIEGVKLTVVHFALTLAGMDSSQSIHVAATRRSWGYLKIHRGNWCALGTCTGGASTGNSVGGTS